jgi:UbiD family decarboxylase
LIPNIGLVSVTGIPYDADEYEVAGVIAGKPVGLVKCKEVDIEGIYRKILTA